MQSAFAKENGPEPGATVTSVRTAVPPSSGAGLADTGAQDPNSDLAKVTRERNRLRDQLAKAKPPLTVTIPTFFPLPDCGLHAVLSSSQLNFGAERSMFTLHFICLPSASARMSPCVLPDMLNAHMSGTRESNAHSCLRLNLTRCYILTVCVTR